MRRRSAFTLVELLVVVAIIALLLSILLPAMDKARAVARTVVCMSNQRQLAMGNFQYAEDYRGTVVASSKNGGSWHHWMGYIRGTDLVTQNGVVDNDPYVPGGPIYGCPDFESHDINIESGVYDGTSGFSPRYGYGMYSPRGLDQDNRDWNFHEYLKTDSPNRTWYMLKPYRAPRPSGIVWLADAGTYVKSWGSIWGGLIASLPSGNWNPDEGDHSGTGVIDWSGRIRLVHDGRAGVAYMDGHAELQNDAELYRTESRIDKFRDFEGLGYTYEPE